MASLAVLRPDAAPFGAESAFSILKVQPNQTTSLHPVAVASNGRRSVTFLVNLPWGSTSVVSLPLEDLPLLTDEEAKCVCCASPETASAGRLALSPVTKGSATGLFVPGYFIFSLAAARAGFPAEVAAAKLRLVLQQREVHPNTCLPLEKVVGTEAAYAIAADWGGKERPEAKSETERGSPLCSLWLLLRLPGGKGGFGALLKKQRRKKRANFSIDACRDLTGRRIRQAQVVTRIKEWMEKKRKEDALVAALTHGAPENQEPEAKPAVSVDPDFISEQLAQVSQMPSVVADGLKQQTALRRQMEAEQRNRAATPQNRALFSQLRDAVELDSEDDQWSDTDSDGQPSELDSNETGNRSSSPHSSSNDANGASGPATATNNPLNERAAATSSGRAFPNTSGTAKYPSGFGGSIRDKGGFSLSPKPDAQATALMQQLEQMRLKNSAAQEEERRRKAEAEAEAARAAAAAERAAQEEERRRKAEAEAEAARVAIVAERVVREAQQLDVSRFSTAEELLKAVDADVVKEKLRQLGWKCGGRPEERAARLLKLKTVDLANVPKALLARPPARMA
ncbi:hypothetical protein, conserved [Eimeria tenella]|uniref:Uncharacterized protein n=1 Tax=Eimeria tenella TaxID=5802 RepID=U6KJ79_EIMTE|nr:hypothetical protein, conserved [Eimeria tenella]CDJ37984.1 hypothetical protein, conserved [Eimeria tenella]|eukprot:XP_013228822.1 hypothetical protein, conserved [Eimeria tenella]